MVQFFLCIKLYSLIAELKTHERCTEKDILVLMMLVVIPGLWSGDCSSKCLTGYICATWVTIYCCLFRNFCSIFSRRPWPFSPDSNLLASCNHQIKYSVKICGREQPCQMQQATYVRGECIIHKFRQIFYQNDYCLHNHFLFALKSFSRKLLATVLSMFLWRFGIDPGRAITIRAQEGKEM